MWVETLKSAAAEAVYWARSSRLWVYCAQWWVHGRVWLHRLTRDEGLAQRNHRVSCAHGRHDVEHGNHCKKDEPTKYGFAAAMGVLFLITCAVYLLAGAIYTAFRGELPDVVTKSINTLMYSRLLHARHDPFLRTAGVEATPDDATPPPRGPYPDFSVRSVPDTTDVADMPRVVREPCRRLSKLELQQGITAEGYEIPLVLMRMCELVHETFGCDNDGFLVPKYIVTPDDLNVCILTYKESDGVCHHYVNPTLRPVLSSKHMTSGIESPHFSSRITKMSYYTTALLSYQPIIDAQVDQAIVPDDPDAMRVLSDAYDALPSPADTNWLSVIPPEQSISVRMPRALSYAVAYAQLTGEFPSEFVPDPTARPET